MKRLRYNWDDEIWLLHLEANNVGRDDKYVTYSRVIKDRGDNRGPKEKVLIKPGEGYRFIISRKSNQEIGLDIEFSKDLLVKIFKLYDRAYIPSTSDIFYNNG